MKKLNTAIDQAKKSGKLVLLNVCSAKCSDCRGVKTLLSKSKTAKASYIICEVDEKKERAEWEAYAEKDAKGVITPFALPLLVFIDPVKACCTVPPGLLKRVYGALTPGTLESHLKSVLPKK